MDWFALLPIVHFHKVSLRIINAQIVVRLLQEVTTIFSSRYTFLTDFDSLWHRFAKRAHEVFFRRRSSSLQLRAQFESWAVGSLSRNLLRVLISYYCILPHKRFV